jgi:hypothetical protein
MVGRRFGREAAIGVLMMMMMQATSSDVDMS